MEGASEGERQEKGGRKMTVPKAEMGGATTGRSATPPAPAASTLAVHRRHRRKSSAQKTVFWPTQKEWRVPHRVRC